MNDVFVYDKAKWHYEGNYPPDLPEENAYTYSGIFLTWLIRENFLDSTFVEDFQTDIQQLRERGITPGCFFQIVDGVLASDMLSEEGKLVAAGLRPAVSQSSYSISLQRAGAMRRPMTGSARSTAQLVRL
jgi:hypothetical protein